MEHDDEKTRLKVRTVWISDLHLGTPGCQAKALLKFLRDTHCDTLYLVGDIVDACGEDLNQVIAVHYSFLAVGIGEDSPESVANSHDQPI